MKFRTKLSPLMVMLWSLSSWLFIAWIASTLSWGSGADYILGRALIFAPVVCLVAYNVLLLMNRPWRRRNWTITLFVEGILIIWVLFYIVFYRPFL